MFALPRPAGSSAELRLRSRCPPLACQGLAYLYRDDPSRVHPASAVDRGGSPRCTTTCWPTVSSTAVHRVEVA